MSQPHSLPCLVFLDSHVFYQISGSAGSAELGGIFLCEWREAFCALGWLAYRLPCEMPTSAFDPFLYYTSPLSFLPPQKLSDPTRRENKVLFFSMEKCMSFHVPVAFFWGGRGWIWRICTSTHSSIHWTHSLGSEKAYKWILYTCFNK